MKKFEGRDVIRDEAVFLTLRIMLGEVQDSVWRSEPEL